MGARDNCAITPSMRLGLQESSLSLSKLQQAQTGCVSWSDKHRLLPDRVPVGLPQQRRKRTKITLCSLRFLCCLLFEWFSYSSVPHSHPVEEWSQGSRIGVRVTRCAGLVGEVLSQQTEGRAAHRFVRRSTKSNVELRFGFICLVFPPAPRSFICSCKTPTTGHARKSAGFKPALSNLGSICFAGS